MVISASRFLELIENGIKAIKGTKDLICIRTYGDSLESAPFNDKNYLTIKQEGDYSIYTVYYNNEALVRTTRKRYAARLALTVSQYALCKQAAKRIDEMVANASRTIPELSGVVLEPTKLMAHTRFQIQVLYRDARRFLEFESEVFEPFEVLFNEVWKSDKEIVDKLSERIVVGR